MSYDISYITLIKIRATNSNDVWFEYNLTVNVLHATTYKLDMTNNAFLDKNKTEFCKNDLNKGSKVIVIN